MLQLSVQKADIVTFGPKSAQACSHLCGMSVHLKKESRLEPPVVFPQSQMHFSPAQVLSSFARCPAKCPGSSQSNYRPADSSSCKGEVLTRSLSVQSWRMHQKDPGCVLGRGGVPDHSHP